MSELHLADVIDYQRDIEPYPIVQIYSGVGSGKNTFIEKLILGEVEGAPKGLKVLLITSRRAKVDETLTYYDGEESLKIFCDRIGLEGNLFVRRWYAEEREEFRDNLFVIRDKAGVDHHIYQNSVICTNAVIAAYHRYCYDPRNEVTWLWNKFDLIVIDEAHSLFTDATYQEAPFHINEMIRRYMSICSEAISDPRKQMPNCKHIILMTGTPMLLKEYYGAICPANVGMNILDVRERCSNVVPKKVYFIENSAVKKTISDILRDGKRVIYFSNHTQTPAEFCRKTDIPQDKVAVSFSKDKRRSALKKDHPEAYADMLLTEKSLREDFKIPEQFGLFVTTERYKEGVNVWDPIDYMFVEAHSSSDVIQMVGRVRSGVEALYIVVDAYQNDPAGKNDAIDRIVEETMCRHGFDISFRRFQEDETIKPEKYNNVMDLLSIQNFVRYAPKLLEEESDEMSQRDILIKYETQFNDRMEEKFVYIRYSYIGETFRIYDLKMEGIDYKLQAEEIWEEARKAGELVPLVSSWFPGSEVLPYDEAYYEAWDYWKQNGLKCSTENERTEYSEEEFNTHIRHLAELFGLNPNRPKAVLKRFSHYRYGRCGEGNRKRYFYDLDAQSDSQSGS